MLLLLLLSLLLLIHSLDDGLFHSAIHSSSSGIMSASMIHLFAHPSIHPRQLPSCPATHPLIQLFASCLG